MLRRRTADGSAVPGPWKAQHASSRRTAARTDRSGPPSLWRPRLGPAGHGPRAARRLRPRLHRSVCGPGGDVLSRMPGPVACSHADVAPPGVDVTEPVSTAELRSRVGAGPAAYEAAEDLGVPMAAASNATTPAVKCDGDGSSGFRVQAMYVVEAGHANRYASLLPNFKLWAAGVDDVINRSAAVTGGVRNVRYVTESGCRRHLRGQGPQRHRAGWFDEQLQRHHQRRAGARLHRPDPQVPDVDRRHRRSAASPRSTPTTGPRRPTRTTASTPSTPGSTPPAGASATGPATTRSRPTSWCTPSVR